MPESLVETPAVEPVATPEPFASVPAEAPAEDPAVPAEDEASLPAWARRALTKANNDAAKYRTELRAAQPIVDAHNKAEEANKTEVQKATERAEQLAQELAARDHALNRLQVAHKYGIPEEDFDFLGSGTPEEMEDRAARLAQLRESAKGPIETPAPPTNRPVESLRPGASPQPPAVEDTSYPASWRPATRGQS